MGDTAGCFGKTRFLSKAGKNGGDYDPIDKAPPEAAIDSSRASRRYTAFLFLRTILKSIQLGMIPCSPNLSIGIFAFVALLTIYFHARKIVIPYLSLRNWIQHPCDVELIVI
jgi:hypothetical protein